MEEDEATVWVSYHSGQLVERHKRNEQQSVGVFHLSQLDECSVFCLPQVSRTVTSFRKDGVRLRHSQKCHVVVVENVGGAFESVMSEKKVSNMRRASPFKAMVE